MVKGRQCGVKAGSDSTDGDAVGLGKWWIPMAYTLGASSSTTAPAAGTPPPADSGLITPPAGGNERRSMLQVSSQMGILEGTSASSASYGVHPQACLKG